MPKKTLRLKVAWNPRISSVVVTVPAFPHDDAPTEILLPAEYENDPPYFEGIVLRGEPVTEEHPSIVGTKKIIRPATDIEFNEFLGTLHRGETKTITARMTELANYTDEARVSINVGPAHYFVVLHVAVGPEEYGYPGDIEGHMESVWPAVEMESIDRLLEVLVQHLYPGIEITI